MRRSSTVNTFQNVQKDFDNMISQIRQTRIKVGKLCKYICYFMILANLANIWNLTNTCYLDWYYC